MASIQQREAADLHADLDREDDPRKALARVQLRIKELQDEGSVVPDDLRRAQKALLLDLVTVSQGR